MLLLVAVAVSLCGADAMMWDDPVDRHAQKVVLGGRGSAGRAGQRGTKHVQQH
eukprot:COSAG05_NODE_3587_length_1973_cov_2.347385_2_plen_52_part_01